MKSFVRIRLHVLLWVLMLFYFVFAPNLFALVFIQDGKPLQMDPVLPAESNQIKFSIDGLDLYVKNGEKLYKMYGWALIGPRADIRTNALTREIILISEERSYSFATRAERRNPDLAVKVTDAGVALNRLGFSLLIAKDVIKPGKYRIGIIFRNDSTGSAFYWDKPVYYLVKTPNTFRLEKK